MKQLSQYISNAKEVERKHCTYLYIFVNMMADSYGLLYLNPYSCQMMSREKSVWHFHSLNINQYFTTEKFCKKRKKLQINRCKTWLFILRRTYVFILFNFNLSLRETVTVSKENQLKSITLKFRKNKKQCFELKS